LNRNGLQFALAGIFTIFLIVSSSPLGSSSYQNNSATFSSNLSASSPHSALATKAAFSIVKCLDCWAGYGILKAKSGSVTGVAANFLIPSPLSCSAKRYGAISFAVALDTSPGTLFAAVYQITPPCGEGATYYFAAWEDGLTQTITTVNLNSMTAGDKVSLSVSAYSGYLSFDVNDRTTGEELFASTSASGAYLNAAACITDMLFNGAKTFPQEDYGSVHFTKCTATVNGATKGIGSFGSLIQYVCYNSKGTKVLSEPGKLFQKMNFVVRFKASGP
jgi:Peptidase A4 family